MSNLVSHAQREFRAAGWTDENDKFVDGMQEDICNHVLDLLEVFHNEGHSGTTAPYTVDLFSKLAMFKPLAPLTGEDWEWNMIRDDSTGGMTVYQNKRCGAVFKQSDRFDGKPYYLDAVVFWEWVSMADVDRGKPFKSYFTSMDSMQPIEFPYTPKTEYRFLPTEQFPNEVLDAEV